MEHVTYGKRVWYFWVNYLFNSYVVLSPRLYNALGVISDSQMMTILRNLCTSLMNPIWTLFADDCSWVCTSVRAVPAWPRLTCLSCCSYRQQESTKRWPAPLALPLTLVGVTDPQSLCRPMFRGWRCTAPNSSSSRRRLLHPRRETAL